MSRYVDIDKPIIAWITSEDGATKSTYTVSIAELLDGTVGTLTEDIVRCKDCDMGQYDFMCDHYWCQGAMHTGDFFCAHGRRKVVKYDVPDSDDGDTISRQAAIDSIMEEPSEAWNIYVEVARYEAAKMDERVVNAMVNGVARDCGIELDKDKLNAMAEFYKRLCMCKDCVHCQQTAVTWCMYHDTSVTNKGFCSWGRRKENG